MQTKLKKIYKAKVVNITEAARDLYYINLATDNFSVKAGQFISILCDNHTLRRPFSVMNYENNILTVLFKVKGAGTEYIKNLNCDDIVDFTGAFGNGFNIEDKKSLIIGAGVGIAPVLFLKNELDRLKIENKIMGGFLSKNYIPKNLNLDFIATDDGSFGETGSVINYLEQEIKNFAPEKIYACGPSIVLKKVCEIAQKYNIKTEIAMEKEMACSIGVCRGCVIELANGKNATVCKDGPVFSGDEIKW